MFKYRLEFAFKCKFSFKGMIVDVLLLVVFAKDPGCNYLNQETISHFDTMKGFMVQACYHFQCWSLWEKLWNIAAMDTWGLGLGK